MLRAAITVLAALLVLSCASVGGDGSAASRRATVTRFPHAAANADCFYASRVDNFEVLNHSNLLVFDGRRRVYHVEVSPPSMDLRQAYRIQFSPPTGRICGGPGERLQLGNGSFSRFPMSIIGVYRLDEITQTAVRAHFGQTTPLPPTEDEDADAMEELVTDLEEAVDEAAGKSPSSAEDQEN